MSHKIERVEVFVTALSIRLKRTFSSGSYDTGPAEQLLGKPVMVKIYAQGVVGYAQIRPISPGHFVSDTVHSVVAAIEEIYAPILLGRDIFDTVAISEQFDLRLAGNPAARAVIDIALHDAMGKALGLPIHKLIGGCCQPSLPLEWSVSLADDVGVMVAEAQRAVQEFGITVLCLKAAGRGGWRRDVANYETVRKAIGDDIVLGVDPNTGWTVPDTISAMRAMRHMGLGYIEQPIGRRDLAGLAEIRAQARGVPLMADESLFTIQDAHALAHARAVDVFCIKLYKVGGLSAARQITAIAAASGIQINCGGLAVTSQFEAAASAQFCASVPLSQTFGAAEFAFGLETVGRDPLAADNDFRIVDGAVKVPTGPGLGIVLDEDALAHHTLKKVTITAR
jgi:L-alanine-DL-glutamate epimerase-like enolase superfamily enzyme